MRHAHGWAGDDWNKLAVATAAGHLLECGTQVSGGYFADSAHKSVPDLAHLGCPIAEVDGDGSLVITKVPGSGGGVSERTVKEQLLYEVHDPAAYLTPDVTLDLSGVRLETLGPDRVAVRGIIGHPAPATLKGNLGLRGLWFGEAGISYAGPGAGAGCAGAGDSAPAAGRGDPGADATFRCDRRRQPVQRRRRYLARAGIGGGPGGR